MNLIELSTGLTSLLSGSVIRMAWGEISTWLTKRQDHKYELERMELQAKLDSGAHAQRMEMARFEREKGVEIIRMQTDVDLSKLQLGIEKQDAETWGQAALQAMRPIGVWFVDAWNASIRPAAASLTLYLWLMSIRANDWKLIERDWELMFAILGFFLADRTLAKRGK